MNSKRTAPDEGGAAEKTFAPGGVAAVALPGVPCCVLLSPLIGLGDPGGYCRCLELLCLESGPPSGPAFYWPEMSEWQGGHGAPHACRMQYREIREIRLVRVAAVRCLAAGSANTSKRCALPPDRADSPSILFSCVSKINNLASCGFAPYQYSRRLLTCMIRSLL